VPDDVIADLLRRIADLAPPERMKLLEVEMRQAWGGERTYISKAPPTLKTWALAGSLAAGATLREAFDAAGCSRRTGYRLLSRRWR
jgi:hypothetical protein